MPVSVGQLLEHGDLIDLAERTGARIVVPTGARCSGSTPCAQPPSEIRSITMVTRKPPKRPCRRAVSRAARHRPRGPTNAAQGIRRQCPRRAWLSANVNVAAALSLAGIGPERTRLEIWADPHVTRNTHRIVVEADAARFEMQIENVPTEENPRTGRITALSVIAALPPHRDLVRGQLTGRAVAEG